MSEANQSSGSPSEIAREPEAITFAEFLRVEHLPQALRHRTS